jgi:hypothetical protein
VAGYQTTSCLVARGPSTKFTTYPLSTEWCAFEFVTTDSQNLLRNLKRVDVPPPSVSHVPSPGVSWWPSVLKGNLDAEKIHKAGFDLFVVERPATSVTTAVWLFAIDWSKGRGFFYSR